MCLPDSRSVVRFRVACIHGRPQSSRLVSLHAKTQFSVRGKGWGSVVCPTSGASTTLLRSELHSSGAQGVCRCATMHAGFQRAEPQLCYKPQPETLNAAHRCHTCAASAVFSLSSRAIFLLIIVTCACICTCAYTATSAHEVTADANMSPVTLAHQTVLSHVLSRT